MLQCNNYNVDCRALYYMSTAKKKEKKLYSAVSKTENTVDECIKIIKRQTRYVYKRFNDGTVEP